MNKFDIMFSKKELTFDPAPLILCGNPLPWVKSAKYLGGEITNVLDGYKKDVKCKRAQFIDRNCEIIQEFCLAHPHIKCRLNRIYNSAFFGSVLWDLTIDATRQIVNSWSVATRYMWDIPVNSHRYFVEPLGGMHAETMLITQYISFVQSLRKSTRPSVIYLLEKVRQNVNSVTGRNIRHVLDVTGNKDIFSIKTDDVKKVHKFCETQEDDKWKVDFLKEIVNIGQNVLELDKNLMTKEELSDILLYLTTS